MKGTVLITAALLGALLALPAAADITSGLVAYYPLDGNGQDLSGYGRDGTAVNVVPTADRFGAANAACLFNGTAYFTTWSDGLPTGERTVALWFRRDAGGSSPGAMPLGYGGSDACGTSWIQSVYPDILSRASHCSDQWMNYAYTTQLGVWHHWVVTTSPEGGKFFLDGQPVGTWPFFINNTVVSGKQLGIGAGVSPGGYVPYTDENVTNFSGALDDVRIYNRALSDADVQELFGRADLSIHQTGPSWPVTHGGTISWTLTAHNSGPSVATSVRVRDTLPPGVTFVSAVPSQGTCSDSAGSISCNLLAIASGDSATINISGTLDVVLLVNSTTVSGEEPDQQMADNASTLATEVQCDPSVAREPAAVVPGTTIGRGAPNPFRASTEIPIGLASPGVVDVFIFDASARAVRRFTSARLDRGDQKLRWDGLDNGGRPVVAGTYYCRLSIDGVEYARTLVRVR